jgi:hypothetical protein
MFAVENSTPLPAALVPGLDAEGRTEATVIVKATFRLREGELALADEQAPLLRADEHTAEPGRSSLRREADLSPQKPGTDVLLVGHAWSSSPVAALDVILTAGALRKAVRVTGDRAFFARPGGFGVTDPVPFTRMPLVYERAYGGADGEAFDERNPVGTGFCVDRARAAGLRLPNLEDPESLVTSPDDRPPVAGFGPIARHWLPRRLRFGVADEAWKRDRFPLLPLDFDRRFFHAAHPDLVSSRPFQGGEPVRLEGASEGGPVAFRVPRLDLAIAVSIEGSTSTASPTLDTLLIAPDERRVVLTYRHTFPCPRNYLPIDGVAIDLRRRAA